MEKSDFEAYKERVEEGFDTQHHSNLDHSVMDSQFFDGAPTPDPAYLMFMAKEALKLLGEDINYGTAVAEVCTLGISSFFT